VSHSPVETDRGSEQETDPMDAPPATHPSDQTLYAYGLGKLGDVSADSVGKHLESCPDCRRRVAELSSDSFLDWLRDAQAPPDSPSQVVSSHAGLSVKASGTGSSARPLAQSLPRDLLDHPDYEILRELGQGGMGVVYLAENKLMGRMEVLKVVSGHLINRRGVVDRFLAEVRNAAKLHHSNIVTAYSALRVGDSLILAMEYVEGLDLAKMVKARGPLPVVNASSYVHQAALGLQHAHEQGMVHRDIKPSNLMLARQGSRAVIKVLDFGLAKVSREVPADGTLTYEGQMLGTPDFIAPEQSIDARRADIRADIYSLGCTLYYLLTGGPPFQGTSLYDILQAHHSRDALPLNQARPEVPVELAALVAKMMAKEPERRFQAPGEVAKALSPFFKKRSVGFSTGNLGSSQVISEANPGSPEATQAETDVPSGPAARSQRGATGSESMWASLIDFKETEIEPVGFAKEVTPVRGHPRWVRFAFAGVVGFAAMVLGAVITYRIVTDSGELVIETDDREIEVVVKQGGQQVTIVDPKTKDRIDLKAGRYELELAGGGEGLKLSTSRLTLKRGDKTVVTVRREAPAPAPARKYRPAPDRLAGARGEEVGEIAQFHSQPRTPEAIPAPRDVVGELLRFGPGGGYWLNRVSFSRDGRYAIAAGGGVIWYDLESGREVRRVMELGRARRGLALSADGRFFLTAHENDPVLRLGDIAFGNEVRAFLGHAGGLLHCALSPDGSLAVSAGADKTLRLWNVANGKEVRRFTSDAGAATCVAFLSDGRRVLSGHEGIGGRGEICLWNAVTGKEDRRLEGHSGTVHAVAVSPGDRSFLSASEDGTVRVWEIESGRLVRRVARGGKLVGRVAHEGAVHALAVSPDGRRVLSSGWGPAPGALRLWEFATAREVHRFKGHSGHVLDVAFAADSRRALSCDTAGHVILWRLPPDSAPPAASVSHETGQGNGVYPGEGRHP
jgi:serine/threonine protein kinase